MKSKLTLFAFLLPPLAALYWETSFAAVTHKAHEHGAGKLNLIVEGNKLTAQFEIPSESIYGFEHEPHNAAEKQQRTAGGEKLKSKIAEMIVLDSKLNCKFKLTQLNLHAEEADETESTPITKGITKTHSKSSADHSETHAEFVAECSSPLAGTKVHFGFSKFFPEIREVNVQVLSGEKQLGIDVKNNKGEVSL